MALPVSILKNVLNLNRIHVEKCDIEFSIDRDFGEVSEQPYLLVDARPYKRDQGRCPICGKKCARNGYRQQEPSRWRASNLNGMRVFIQYRPQRILCPEHGALNEAVTWADGKSRFTQDFNNEVAWLVCQMSKTAICTLERINWRTVGNCVNAAQNRLEPDVSERIHNNVRRICVDETSRRKGHNYLTVVYDMDKNHVIWVHPGFGDEIFSKFCEQMTPEEREQIEVVAGDGAQWIDRVTKKYFPNATRCVDFFHVVQWVTEALDKVRVNTAKKAKDHYEQTRSEYAKIEKEYQKALDELANMPRKGRPSTRKKELMSFVEEYEASMSDGPEVTNEHQPGRPKKDALSPKHQKLVDELQAKAKDIKGARYALGHNPENCTERQIEKLQLIENSYPDLYQAYQLKEALRLILHMKDPVQASFELDQWIKDAKESGLKPMCKLAEKIQRHTENILNSIKYQANSAKSEATNTMIKGLIKLAYGFRNLDNMIALIYLKCSDIIIPLSHRPQPTEEYLKKKRDRANALRRIREETARITFAA